MTDVVPEAARQLAGRFADAFEQDRGAQGDPCQELTSEVFEYLEGFYNLRRRHSTLGMLSPADYEQQRQRRARGKSKNANGMLKTLLVSNINNDYYNDNDWA